LADRRAAISAAAAVLLSACAGLSTGPAPSPAPTAVPEPKPEPRQPAPAAATAADASAPATPGAQSGPPRGAKPDVIVVFPGESDQPDARAETALQELARRFSQTPHAWILLVAYAETKGSREYSIARAERRGKLVENRLIALGISEKRIRAISYGEEGTAQATRRVVEAYLQQHREP
jgi:outer membrane protein OmpA-like peptidoglycan-associated protein